MGSLLNEIVLFFERLSTLDVAILATNVLLLVFARKILQYLVIEDDDKLFTFKVRLFRALNLLIIMVLGYQRLFSTMDVQSISFKVVAILIVIYSGYLFTHILNYFFRKLYGKQREIDGQKRNIETYQSRILSIIFSVFVFIIVLISVVRLIGFDSLLEAGGVIGFIGVFLALTNNAWAPDIFSGLIILNSRMAEEGDVIELPGVEGCLGVVYKTKLFHTEILNLVNNHRIMFKNAKLREQTIHNLSKFASAKGLRERLVFKIAYDVPEQQVRKMFELAHSMAQSNANINFEWDRENETGILEAGDHAVSWVMYYYTKDVKNLLLTRRRINEYVIKAARELSISLATPLRMEMVGAELNTAD